MLLSLKIQRSKRLIDLSLLDILQRVQKLASQTKLCTSLEDISAPQTQINLTFTTFNHVAKPVLLHTINPNLQDFFLPLRP